MNKHIPNNERLIVALDVPSADQAKAIVETLGEAVVFYKIGLELFMSGDYFELLEWLRQKDKKIFVDLKFFDVPATVGRAVAQLTGKGVSFATIHGNDSIMQAACRPSNTAVTTRSEPRTISPPANTLGLVV